MRTVSGARVVSPFLEGITLQGRAAVVYSPNNLLGAFARDPLGRWLEPCNPGGERQRRLAFHLAVNVVLYALCSDYKQDRIHVPFLRQGADGASGTAAPLMGIGLSLPAEVARAWVAAGLLLLFAAALWQFLALRSRVGVPRALTLAALPLPAGRARLGAAPARVAGEGAEQVVREEDHRGAPLRGRALEERMKLSLATYDGKQRPFVRAMKIYYPRISYLRYLPAIYQEDPVSRDFLERFLSLFESIFYDLEVDISKVTRHLDPDTAPPDFLRWLAAWVNMAIEENWPEETKREFIRQAARLYTMKGTVEGLSRFIEIYTGKTPVILEHAKVSMPAVLGGPFQLGLDTVVGRASVRGFRLGDDSIIGRAALRSVVEAVEDPFLPMAYRFTIVIDLTQEERIRYEKGLKKLITDEKPAHTAYRLRIAVGFTSGADSYIGISTIVGGYDALITGRFQREFASMQAAVRRREKRLAEARTGSRKAAARTRVKRGKSSTPPKR